MLPRSLLRLTIAAGFSPVFSALAMAQTVPEGSAKPLAEQVEEMMKALAEARAEIEQLEQQARRDETRLQELHESIQRQIGELAASPVPAPTPAAAPGVYQAALASSSRGVIVPASTSDPAPTPTPGVPPAILRISDSVYFRFGATLQPTYEAVQDPNSKGYSQNFYLRRARFFLFGELGPDVMVFLQTDDPRVGNAGVTGVKNVNSGFEIIDAFAQWNFLGNAMAIQAGEFLVPGVRSNMTIVSSFLALDIAAFSGQQNTVLQTVAYRDYGVGLTGYFLNDRLSYRFGVFDGQRLGSTPQTPPLGPSAGSRNPMRIAGRLMYDFFDPEASDPRTLKGYACRGTFLGQKKVLAVGLVGDGQGDYKGFGGDAFFDWPFGAGAVTAEADYFHYNGHLFYANTIPEQETLFANAGYYFTAFHLQPFLRYEILSYDLTVNEPKEQSRFGGGLNYYVLGQTFKMTPYYERIFPKVQPSTAQIKDFNRFVVQIQGYF
jgi:hypothetical protein